MEIPPTSRPQDKIYDVQMCLLYLIRGYTRGLKRFTLEYDIENFGDIIFNSGIGKYQIIQLNHSEKFNSNTTDSNTDFSLIKYVQAVIKANMSQKFKDKIDSVVVFTNIGFDLKMDKLSLIPDQIPEFWFNGFASIKPEIIKLNATAIFDLSSEVTDAKYYKFVDDSNIVEIIKRQSQTLFEGQKYEKEDQVKDVELTETMIREALQKLIYAVQQPNALELTKIIKKEIKDHFKLHNIDTIYEKLEKEFQDLCDSKNPHHVLTYADAAAFFQKYMKKVSFGVTEPEISIGRTQELEKIRKTLNEKSSFVLFESITNGFDVTQVTKQFVKEFGRDEFYGRIIWINATNDETVKNSFERLVKMLKISNPGKKFTNVLIDEVFRYFDGFKVLFVFDCCDEFPGPVVTHCLKISKDPMKTFRPFFIFTSRNQDFKSHGVPFLDLTVLSSEDAVQLIIKELMEINPIRTDATKLAKVLQHFSLGIQHAIAYIKQQHKMKQNLEESEYEVQNYLRRFKDKRNSFNDSKFPDNFSEHEKTTFITLNVTLDMIKLDKDHGDDAILVLRILSYLDGNKTDSKMFLPMFNNDEEELDAIFLLLQNFSLIIKIEQETTFYQIHRLLLTLVQLTFKNENDEEEFLERIFQLIYSQYFDIKKCSINQMRHFNTLSLHMFKYEKLKIKYEPFFNQLNDRNLWDAVSSNDFDKLKSLKITPKILKEFFVRHISVLMSGNTVKIIKHFIEICDLDVNEQINGKSLVELTLESRNLETFKYLIERGSDFTGVLKYASVELISEIMNHKSDLLNSLIGKRDCKGKQKILNECLFFALIFNQELIVKIFVENIVIPELVFQTIPLVYVAAVFECHLMIKLLAQITNKYKLFECSRDLLRMRDFTDKGTFEIIFKNYLQKGGDVDAEDCDGKTLLNHVTNHVNVAKLEIADVLLENGADPYLTDNHGENAIHHLLTSHEDFYLSSDVKHRVDEVINQRIINDLTPQKFMNFVFSIKDWATNAYYRDMFEQLLWKIGDINVRNESGETLLMTHLQNKTAEFDTVKFLIEHGIDVDAQSTEGRSALFYATNFDTFQYLLKNVKFVDENVLEVIVEQDRREFFESLIETHFSINYQFKNSKSLVQVAVENVSVRIVLALKDEFSKFREQGNDVNIQDKDGRTLLTKLIVHYLERPDDCVISDVRFLVEHGVNVHLKDKFGKDAFGHAMNLNKPHIFKFLLGKVASVDEQILIEAISRDKASITKALIPRYFNRNYRFKEDAFRNMTPIELAVQCETNDVVMFLERLNTEDDVEDASQLILKELSEMNPSKSDTARLASTLQCFPLALRLTIAYIKEQHKRKEVFGDRYEINDFLKGYEISISDFLDIKYGQTSFIMWNVTLDTIKAIQVDGANAIKLLRILSFLYADKIDAKMFLPLFQNNEERTAEAFLWLEKYAIITKFEPDRKFYQIHRLLQSLVQRMFKNDDPETFLVKTCEIISPELFKHKETKKATKIMEMCSIDQIRHFNTVSKHMLKYNGLKQKFKDFFVDLNTAAFYSAVTRDDTDKIKVINISKGYMRKFVEVNIDQLMNARFNKTIKYFIEIGVVGINDRFNDQSLISFSLKATNIELFQFLLGKGADFSDIQEFDASVEIISEIRQGKSDSILSFIRKIESEDKQKILNECLFFAVVLNQETIVRILLENMIIPGFLTYKQMPLVYVAVKLSYVPILMRLLQVSDKNGVFKHFCHLFSLNFPISKEIFEIIFKIYREKGGDVNDLDARGYSILFHATNHVNLNILNLEFTHFLLENGADPFISNKYGYNSVYNLLKAHESDRLTPDLKHRIDEILQKIFHNLKPETFINSVIKGLCNISNWLTNEYYQNIFESLIKTIKDINVRNDKGQTLLISYVLEYFYTFPEISIIKHFVEDGVDIDAEDNEGKSVLFYAVGLDDIFHFLLDKVKHVNENVLINAIEQDNLLLLQTLLKKHFSVNHRFRNGKRLIQIAVENYSIEIILYLKTEFKKFVEKGHDVNVQDKDGRTLLMKLIHNLDDDEYDDHIDDVKFLVENGVRVDLKDKDKKSVLDYLSHLWKSDIYLYLLGKSESVDEDVLIDAILRNKLLIVEALVPKYFNKDYRFKDGYYKDKTALEVAKERKRFNIVDFIEYLST